MSTKLQRILLILLLIGSIVYTAFNYHTGRTELTTAVVLLAFSGWLLFGQIRALIREWDEK